ncbi:hypothetical protein BDZ89DRAFT_1174111 [Hymenopellis radicata]|nr:hypothetical protein BDZ89DRAFT_1174111 [Hymenopellis radicata]
MVSNHRLPIHTVLFIQQAPSITKGYTFLNEKMFMSEKSKALLLDLLKQSGNMSSYNDSSSYALLGLVDSMLSKINSKVKHKAWDEAFTHLEALTFFFDLEDSWPQCDDGERVKITNQAYGSLLVTVLRALKQEGRLDTEHYPNLETVLKYAAGWGDLMDSICCSAGYDRICRAMGYRLFKNKTEEQRALEKARVEEWIASMNASEKAAYLEQKRQDEEDEDDDEDVEEDWFLKGKNIDEDEKHKDLVLSRVWNDYKACLRR